MKILLAPRQPFDNIASTKKRRRILWYCDEKAAKVNIFQHLKAHISKTFQVQQHFMCGENVHLKLPRSLSILSFSRNFLLSFFIRILEFKSGQRLFKKIFLYNSFRCVKTHTPHLTKSLAAIYRRSGVGARIAFAAGKLHRSYSLKYFCTWDVYIKVLFRAYICVQVGRVDNWSCSNYEPVLHTALRWANTSHFS